MTQCAAAPHLFRDEKRGIILELHVDDYHACGPREQLEAFQADLEKSVMINQGVHDPRSGQLRGVRALAAQEAHEA